MIRLLMALLLAGAAYGQQCQYIYNPLTGLWNCKTGTGGGGGGGTPAGSSGQLQYNNGGAFGALSEWTYSGGALIGSPTGKFRPPTSTSLPGSCTAPEIFVKSDASSSRQIYLCVSGAWVQQGVGNVACSTGITCSTGGDGGLTISTDATMQTTAGDQAGSARRCNSTTGSMTYACSMSPTLTSYTTGMVVEFACATTALTGAATLNIDLVGAKSIKKADGTTDPSPGDCIVGQQIPLRYDGTVFRLPNGNPAFETLTDASTITWALAYRQTTNATVTLGGSRTLNITNPVTGGSYVLRVVQDGTGSRGLTLGTGCTWKVSGGGSGAITPTTTASAIDVLAFTYDGTNCYANFNKNFN